MGALVRHKAFGQGNVIKIEAGFIEVQFGSQMKKFQFPQAFGAFLDTQDAELLKKISEAKAAAVPAAPKPSMPVHSSSKVSTAPKSTVQRYSSYANWDISNPLVGERAQTIPVASEEEMFEIIGYMARPGRVNSIEAEVPKDGRDAVFEKMFPGQTYRPIELGHTPSGMPNKLSPQFRINFGNLSNCPNVLKANMGKGNGSCVGRINKSKFVILIVQKYGFRFGDWQDRAAIREIAVKKGFADAFDRGYAR